MWRTAGRAAGCHFTRINVNTEKYSSVVNWREQIRSLVMKLTPVVERSVTSFRSWHVIIPRFFVLLCIFSLAISLSLSLSLVRALSFFSLCNQLFELLSNHDPRSPLWSRNISKGISMISYVVDLRDACLLHDRNDFYENILATCCSYYVPK